ncbi:peptidase C69, partial [Candidatus Falkowbacteria bacterium]|nr:peptidase C69 [Candidatus Falkowbacteria bacterium]
NQKNIEQKALDAYNAKNPAQTRQLLTDYTNEWGTRVVDQAWKLGDLLWTKYDEQF